MSGVFTHSFSSSGNDMLLLERVAEFLDSRDMGRCGKACKLFLTVMYKDQGFWIRLSEQQGIPLVAGKDRDRKADFQALYPITLSGARISRILGKVLGEIPCISEEVFNKLNTKDPFEEKKLMKDTWVFVVVPAYVERTVSPRTPLGLNDEGNLVEIPKHRIQKGSKLKIPLSLKNIEVLCFYLLRGKKNKPVFHKLANKRVFEQCGASSDKTSVYFMRRWIVEESRSLPYAEQEELVGRFKFGVTSMRVRALFDAITILESKTCPDDVVGPFHRLARCSDTVLIKGYGYHPVIGDFFRCTNLRGRRIHYGVKVYYTRSNIAHNVYGVVPSISAEVPQ
jgi:hypothetical protein